MEEEYWEEGGGRKEEVGGKSEAGEASREDGSRRVAVG
jgi:hypothetical protein